MHDEMRLLLALVAVSAIGPIVAARLRLPSAVVLILAGIGIGPAGLGLVQDTPMISFVAELGFLVLMFIAGMEIDFDGIRAAGPRALILPVLACVGTLGFAFVAARVLGLSMIYVLILNATSVGMPLAMLQETGQLKTQLGRTIMIVVSMGEFVSIVAITAFELSVRFGLSFTLLAELGKLVGLFVCSIVLIRWSRAFVWWYPEPFRRLVVGRDTAEIGVRVGLMVMFLFVVLAGLLGVEPILGAFIGGALLAFVLRDKGALEQKIAAVGNGLLIPSFFIVIGVRFQADALTLPSVKQALVLIAAAGVVKIASSLLFVGWKLRVWERMAAASLYSAPLTLVVAIGAVGQRVGALTADALATIILVAIGLSVVFPTIFRVLVSTFAEPETDAP